MRMRDLEKKEEKGCSVASIVLLQSVFTLATGLSVL